MRERSRKYSRSIARYIAPLISVFDFRQRLEGSQGVHSGLKARLYVFGFSGWKTFIIDWFPDFDVVIAPTKISAKQFNKRWRRRILNDGPCRVLSWQYKGPPNLKAFCDSHAIQFQYVEDGFIRSLKLGAEHTAPLSLSFDSRDMYFVSDRVTDLETILSDYDFGADHALMERARCAIEVLLSSGLSKYNSGAAVNADLIYGKKSAPRILVAGQVESDASIAYGCNRPFTNNDLVRLARSENPDAEIIYKPHPEVLTGIASKLSNPDDVRGIATILDQDISLSNAFQSIDHVYTITSLSGFEALLRGIKVTTVGCPFYSGWGITDDRQPNSRRIRKLSVEEVFAGAYILYPRYFDPQRKEYVEIEDVLAILSRLRVGAG